jgi:hypothetical protein
MNNGNTMLRWMSVSSLIDGMNKLQVTDSRNHALHASTSMCKPALDIITVCRPAHSWLSSWPQLLQSWHTPPQPGGALPAHAADISRIGAFLRRAVHFGYHADSVPTVAIICAEAHDKPLTLVKSNSQYLLYPLLPLTDRIKVNSGVVPTTTFNLLSAPQLFVILILFL